MKRWRVGLGGSSHNLKIMCTSDCRPLRGLRDRLCQPPTAVTLYLFYNFFYYNSFQILKAFEESRIQYSNIIIIEVCSKSTLKWMGLQMLFSPLNKSTIRCVGPSQSEGFSKTVHLFQKKVRHPTAFTTVMHPIHACAKL